MDFLTAMSDIRAERAEHSQGDLKSDSEGD